MRKILLTGLALLMMAGYALCDDELDTTYEKVDKYLYGNDPGGEPPAEQAKPAKRRVQEPVIEDIPAVTAPPETVTTAPATDAAPDATGLLGCFKDDQRRDLKEKQWSDGKMTPIKCVNFCREEGFKFAGVQNGSQCFCGNRYGKYGKIADKMCKSPCSGDSDLDCGGSWANAVYSVGAAPQTQTAPPPLAVVSVAGGKALGCFKDDDRRDLKEKFWDDGQMTPAKCVNFCKEEGFKYAGVQSGSNCFCGNRYGKYGQIPDKNCKSACAGDSDLDCGGSWANSVFEVPGTGGQGQRR